MLLVAGVVILLGASVAMITGIITVEEFMKVSEYVFMMLTGLSTMILVKAWAVTAVV